VVALRGLDLAGSFINTWHQGVGLKVKEAMSISKERGQCQNNQ